MKWTSSARNSSRNFDSFKDVIHIDEKWFYICKINQKYYLFDGENEPERFVQHKAHVTKVMFLAAVARPRWDSSRNCFFDGKIGFLPLVEQVPAQRSSRNRPARSLETKTYSVTKESYKKLLLESVIPKIFEKFPCHHSQEILIQQDNATPHRIFDDPGIMEACSSGRRRITRSGCR